MVPLHGAELSVMVMLLEPAHGDGPALCTMPVSIGVRSGDAVMATW